jgi:hypothetical protein
MDRHDLQEETGRVLGLWLLVWAVCVGAATFEGVFDSLSRGEFAALALFAALYASAAYRVDRNIREYVLGLPARELGLAAGIVNLALAVAVVRSAPWPLVAFFGAPLAIAVHFALAERLLHLRRPLMRAAARSPGGNPAAT